MKNMVRCLIGVAVVAGLVAGGCYAAGDKAKGQAVGNDQAKKAVATLQSKSDYIVLHLDRDNANLILPAIESRTGVKIQRLTTDQ